MFSFAATFRALLSDSGLQHLFPIDQNFIKTPMTSKPFLFKRAAATEESTPPDIAIITFFMFFYSNLTNKKGQCFFALPFVVSPGYRTNVSWPVSTVTALPLVASESGPAIADDVFTAPTTEAFPAILS